MNCPHCGGNIDERVQALLDVRLEVYKAKVRALRLRIRVVLGRLRDLEKAVVVIGDELRGQELVQVDEE
jgi:hypothetical protein